MPSDEIYSRLGKLEQRMAVVWAYMTDSKKMLTGILVIIIAASITNFLYSQSQHDELVKSMEAVVEALKEK